MTSIVTNRDKKGRIVVRVYGTDNLTMAKKYAQVELRGSFPEQNYTAKVIGLSVKFRELEKQVAKKASPAKAKRVKNKIAEQKTKRPVVVNQQIITTEPPEEVAREVAEKIADTTPPSIASSAVIDHDWSDAVLPQRFEDYDYFGEASIIDNHTGFIARFTDVETRDVMLDGIKISGDEDTFVDGLDWTHIQSGARTYVTAQAEHNRFFLLDHLEAGLGILDRFTQGVYPLGWDTTYEQADSVLDLLNENGLASIPGQLEGLLSIDDWLSVKSVVDGGESPTPREPAEVADEVELKQFRILVISSSRWVWTSLLEQQVRSLLASSGLENNVPVIITSGSPNGAEAGARALAEANGWDTETVRDEGIGHAEVDYGFAYITNQSAGAEAALEYALAARIPMHITRETPAILNDPWAGR